jgi:hypothetical protein
MISTVQELCKISLRMDQPNTALERYTAALQVWSAYLVAALPLSAKAGPDIR